MSKEYIERGALIEKRHKVCEYDEAGFCMSYQAVSVEDIQQAPAADVVEVVHGRWETANDGTHFCSNCGCDATYTWDDIDRSFINSADDVPDRITNFCQNCGAKMDGGADNAVD